MKFNIGDLVMLDDDPENLSAIVDVTIEETGRVIYKVESKGCFYAEDLKPAPVQNRDIQSGAEGRKVVMVTGGAGYVGSVLVRKLLLAGYRVVCIDNLRYGGRSLMDVWDHPHFLFRKLDITHFSDVARMIASDQYFAVVHLAAIVGDPACKLEPDLAIKTNRDASVHILETAIQSNIPRFIFASTCSNYGKMKNSEEYVDEDSLLSPISLYAKLKVELEDLLLNGIEKRDSFCPTCLRFATVFGISPRMRFDLTVSEFTKELALGRELIVFGEQFWRPYCYVGDLARAILCVLRAAQDQVAYKVFNVGDISQNYTKKMIVDELLRQIPDGQVRYVQRKEDPRDYRVRFDRIRDVLGFKISKTVPEGIRNVVSSIKLGIIDNPDDPQYYNIPTSK